MDKLELAKKRVEAKKGFILHSMITVAIILFFFLFNLGTYSKSQKWWFYYPALVFGVLLFIHAFIVYIFPFIETKLSTWEDKELAREYRKLEKEEQKLLEKPETDTLELLDNELDEVIKLKGQDNKQDKF